MRIRADQQRVSVFTATLRMPNNRHDGNSALDQTERLANVLLPVPHADGNPDPACPSRRSKDRAKDEADARQEQTGNYTHDYSNIWVSVGICQPSRDAIPTCEGCRCGRTGANRRHPPWRCLPLSGERRITGPLPGRVRSGSSGSARRLIRLVPRWDGIQSLHEISYRSFGGHYIQGSVTSRRRSRRSRAAQLTTSGGARPVIGGPDDL